MKEQVYGINVEFNHVFQRSSLTKKCMNIEQYNNDPLVFKRFRYYDYPDRNPLLCNKGDETMFKIRETSKFDYKEGSTIDK